MKRMLSVFLSMVLLVSSVVIPMSVNATETELTPEDAYNAVMKAVNNLELDFENVVPKEYAIPSYSFDGSAGTSGTDYNLNVVSDSAQKATLGSKTIELLKDKKITNTNGVLLKDHLHVAEYTTVGNSGEINDYLYLNRIGYLVVYVKSARPFKMSVAASNNQTSNANFLNGTNAVNVPATTGDNYTRVVINIQSGVDWKSFQRLYAAEYRVQKLHLSVQAMTDEYFNPLTENNTIEDDDHITFGSVFYVPVDYDVRDFKYDAGYFKSDYANYYPDDAKDKLSTISTRYTTLSAEMIAAAEKISNDDGHYTYTSFKKLQDAITAAKKALFLNGDTGDNVNDFVNLFKNEVKNLYKLEEVFVPSSVNNSKADLPYSNASEINNGSLSAAQQKSFGEKLFKVNSDKYVTEGGKQTRSMRFTAPDASDVTPSFGKNVKYFNNYRNLYLAVENTGDSFKLDQFTSYNTWYTAISLANVVFKDGNKEYKKLQLESGYNLINLYDVGVASYYYNVMDENGQKAQYVNDKGETVYPSFHAFEKNILFFIDYMAKYSTNEFEVNGTKYEEKNYINGSNVIVLNFTSIPENTDLYIGSIMGERVFDTTVDNNAFNNLSTVDAISQYYGKNIKSKGYEGTDDIVETFEILGYTNIEVVREIENEISILDTNGQPYYLGFAEENSIVRFKLNTSTLESGVTADVRYGDQKITPDAEDVYQITVTKGNKLFINPSYKVNEYQITSEDQFNSHYNQINNLILNQDAVIATTYPELDVYGKIKVDSNGKHTIRRDLASDRNISNLTDGKFDLVARQAGSTNKDIGVGFPHRMYTLRQDDNDNYLNSNGEVVTDPAKAQKLYNGKYYNGYQPYDSSNQDTVFDFDRTQNGDAPFEFYTDIIFDIGYVADINKVMHIGPSNSSFSFGAYEIFASENVEDLFNRDALVGSYQSKNYKTINSQIWEFPSKTARFVAFRVYCLIGDQNETLFYFYDTIRSLEIAVGGTKAENQVDPGYTVSTANLGQIWYTDVDLDTRAGNNNDGLFLEHAEDVSSILTNSEVELSISGMNNGNKMDSAGTVKDPADTSKNFTGNFKEHLNDKKIAASTKYFQFGDFKLKSNSNGYTVSRNVDGTTIFTRTGDTANTYIDFTYDLKDYYDIKQFNVYGYGGTDYTNYGRIEAYEVYVANNRESLYESKSKVAYYENIFNTTGQRLTFNKSHAGKYIGLRILYSSTDSPLIGEIAAFGNKITDLTKVNEGETNANLKPADCDSGSVFIFNQNSSSVYKKDGMTTVGVDEADNEELRTSMRLSLGYKCPVVNGEPQADKILLDGDGEATIVERNIIVGKYISGITYDDSTFNISSSDFTPTSATGEKLTNYFYYKEDSGKVYATSNFYNMKSTLINSPFVVRGRIVYKTTDGKYYCFYTPIVGTDPAKKITAQNVYDSKFKDINQKWFNNVLIQ